MRIEYDLKFRDYLKFNLAHQICSARGQVLATLLCLLLALTFVGGLGSGVATTIIGIIAFVTAYLCYWTLTVMLLLYSLASRKNRALFTHYTVEVQDEAFYEETAFVKTHRRWVGFVNVVQHFGVIAVYASAYGAYLIPVRAFDTPETARRFADAVRFKIHEARSTRPRTSA